MEEKHETISKWIKLDNAATIYPATLSKKYAGMFRMSAQLRDTVDKEILSLALNNVIKRFPMYRYQLKQGFFWHYFRFNDNIPIIQDDYRNPLVRINFKQNSNFMFRVRIFNKRISIEYFHSLTDGYGGITFLLTLVAEYIRIKYKAKISYTKNILNPTEYATKEEIEDSFLKYSRGYGEFVKEHAAYHQKGILEPSYKINIISGKIPIDKVKEIAKEYNCTITQFIVSVMIDSFQTIQEQEIKNIKKRKQIKISVPINLRNIYNSNTLRNFSSYVNIGIDPKYGHFSFKEIINEVKSNMSIMTTEKRLNAKITGNVKLAKNIFIRIIPMAIKKHILSLGEKLYGDRYVTSTMSNLGLIEVPKNITKYIDDLGVIIGRPRTNPGAGTCVGYNGNLYITFSRKIRETEFEKLFFRRFVELGIPVEIESNGGI